MAYHTLSEGEVDDLMARLVPVYTPAENAKVIERAVRKTRGPQAAREFRQYVRHVETSNRNAQRARAKAEATVGEAAAQAKLRRRRESARRMRQTREARAAAAELESMGILGTRAM
jgi:hypothetical protein